MVSRYIARVMRDTFYCWEVIREALWGHDSRRTITGSKEFSSRNLDGMFIFASAMLRCFGFLLYLDQHFQLVAVMVLSPPRHSELSAEFAYVGNVLSFERNVYPDLKRV